MVEQRTLSGKEVAFTLNPLSKMSEKNKSR